LQIHQTNAGIPAAHKLGCFEAIRGLAALAVVVGHFILGFWPGLYFRKGLGWDQSPSVVHALVRFPGKFLWDGHMAVSLFFVLSGFVLSLSGFRNGAPALGSAAVRRFPRLMFPVAASILLAFTLMKLGVVCNQDAVRFMNDAQGLPHETDPNAGPGESNGWLTHYYDFTPDLSSAVNEGAWGAFTGTARYNLPLWTMQLELIGSFLVFGFLALFGKLRNRWLLYGLAGGLLFLTERHYLLDFVLGMALCDLWVHNQRTWRRSLPAAPALVLIGMGLFLVPWKLLAALLVVGATAAAPRVQRFLEARWLAFLGRLSFGLYLVHMPIFCSLGCGLYLGLCRGLGWSHVAGSLVAALASLVATILGAWAFAEVVDRPTVALTHRLDSWLFRPLAKIETAVPSEPHLSEAHAA
jgi:peptidoglycan/LPS O-acetylase OafA/YrhL